LIDRKYLLHIQEAIDEAREMTRGMDRAAYLGDRIRQRAVEREVQIIGDAVHKLSPVAARGAGRPRPKLPLKTTAQTRRTDCRSLVCAEVRRAMCTHVKD